MDENGKLLVSTRWLARIASLASIAILGLFALGPGESLQFQSASEIFGFSLFPIGIVAGMLLAWRWEVVGGAVTLLSLLGFYIWHFCASGKFASGPYFLIFALPGIALLLIGLACQIKEPRRG